MCDIKFERRYFAIPFIAVHTGIAKRQSTFLCNNAKNAKIAKNVAFPKHVCFSPLQSIRHSCHPILRNQKKRDESITNSIFFKKYSLYSFCLENENFSFYFWLPKSSYYAQKNCHTQQLSWWIFYSFISISLHTIIFSFIYFSCKKHFLHSPLFYFVFLFAFVWRTLEN